MAQIKGEDYTDLQTDASDIEETNTIKSVSFKRFVEARRVIKYQM